PRKTAKVVPVLFTLPDPITKTAVVAQIPIFAAPLPRPDKPMASATATVENGEMMSSANITDSNILINNGCSVVTFSTTNPMTVVSFETYVSVTIPNVPMTTTINKGNSTIFKFPNLPLSLSTA